MRSFGQRKSRLQERRAAADLGGSVQPGSGAMEFAKGDVRVAGEIRAECKTTSKKTYILKLAELQKIQQEALMGRLEESVLQVEFQGQVGQNHRYAVIPWASYLQLRESK